MGFYYVYLSGCSHSLAKLSLELLTQLDRLIIEAFCNKVAVQNVETRSKEKLSSMLTDQESSII